MKCSICGKPVVAAYRPFCSRRCADVDLGKWLTGAYALPDTGAEDDEAPPPGTDGDRDTDRSDT